LLSQGWTFERRARGARQATATLFFQGQHLNHGAKVDAFAVAWACITERVKHVGYLLRERLGDVEAVAVDIEEGAAIAEAIPEAGEVVADAVEGAKPPDKAGGDLLTEG
jgi:hypothetical protein